MVILMVQEKNMEIVVNIAEAELVLRKLQEQVKTLKGELKDLVEELAFAEADGTAPLESFEDEAKAKVGAELDATFKD